MVINLTVNSKREAITYYLGLISRFHKMTDKESKVAVELILKFYEYLDKYKVEDVVYKLYLEKGSKEDILKNLPGMSPQVLNNYLTTLRNKKVLGEGNVLNKVLLPNINNVSITVNMIYAREKLS